MKVIKSNTSSREESEEPFPKILHAYMYILTLSDYLSFSENIY